MAKRHNHYSSLLKVQRIILNINIGSTNVIEHCTFQQLITHLAISNGK